MCFLDYLYLTTSPHLHCFCPDPSPHHFYHNYYNNLPNDLPVSILLALQAYITDIACLVSDYCSEASLTIMRVIILLLVEDLAFNL